MVIRCFDFVVLLLYIYGWYIDYRLMVGILFSFLCCLLLVLFGFGCHVERSEFRSLDRYDDEVNGDIVRIILYVYVIYCLFMCYYLRLLV